MDNDHRGCIAADGGLEHFSHPDLRHVDGALVG